MLLERLRLDAGQRDAPVSHRGAWLVAGGLVFMLLVGGGVFLSRDRALEVKAATAEPKSIEASPTAALPTTTDLQATGYVTARRQATVSAQITGTLTEVMIEEGEHIKAGQVLAHLDSTAQRASLAQSAAQVQVAQALLVQVQAQLWQGRRDLQRDLDLIDRHLISQQALEAAQTNVASLEAQVESQRRQVELWEAGARGAQVQLDYTSVHAPFDGVIIAKAAQVGEIISPTSAGGGFTRTGICTLVDMDSLEIEVDVNESYINRVQANQPAQAVLDAYPDWTIPAHVIAIIPTADRSKATVKVRIAIESKDQRILPDMGVRVSFLNRQKAAQSADTTNPRIALEN